MSGPPVAVAQRPDGRDRSSDMVIHEGAVDEDFRSVSPSAMELPATPGLKVT